LVTSKVESESGIIFEFVIQRPIEVYVRRPMVPTSIVLLGCLALAKEAFSVTLPPGMSATEAKSIAAQNGVTVGPDGKPQLPPGMTEAQARGIAGQYGVTLPPNNRDSTVTGRSSTDGTGGTIESDVDPNEGFLKPGTKRKLKQDRSSRDTGSARSKLPSDSIPKLVRWGQSIFQNSSDLELAAAHVGAVGPDYAMGPGDEIILTIWGQKEARYTLQLDRDGQIFIELVGVVSLNGQTFKSATDLLRKRLAKVYSGLANGSTQMDVTLGKLKQNRVYVVGDVANPGSYMLSGNTSVLAALMMAQGPSDLGSERDIEVRRGATTFKVDLYDYLARGRRPDQDNLQDGDVVRVPRAGDLITIQGDVGRPAIYELKPSEGARELLEYAGGANPSAADHPLMVLRIFPGGRREMVRLATPTEIASQVNPTLKNQDSVLVYRGKDPSQATVTILGEVRYPGPYPWKTGMTLKNLLETGGGPTPTAVTELALLKRHRLDGTIAFSHERLDSSGSATLLPLDTVTLVDRLTFHDSDSVSIAGAVRIPQKISYRPGMTLRDLVVLSGGPKMVSPPSGVFENGSSIKNSVSDTMAKVSFDSLLWCPAGRAVVHRKVGDGRTRVEMFPMTPIPNIPLAEGDVVQIVDLLASNKEDSVNVTGQVAHPGRQIGSEGLTVRQAIVRAGGFLPGADPSFARLEIPQDSGGAVLVPLVLDSALNTPDADRLVPMRALIGIPPRLDRQNLEEVTLMGEVRRPGVYAMQTRQESITSILKRAGGLRLEAYPEAGYLMRSDYGGTGRVVFDLTKALEKPGSKYDIPMRPGDVLTFPRRPVTLQVKGRVNNPGLVTWQDGASWRTYVDMAGGFDDSANTDGVYVELPNGRVQTRSAGIDDPLPGSVIVVPYTKPKEPITFKDLLSGVNAVLATVIAGLTILVLMNK